jgi:uncharacterized protein HemX
MTIEDLFDRRVPLAIVAALCLQAGGIVWWAATRDSDAHFQQRRIDHLEEAANETRASQTEMLQRLARIEERVTAEASSIERIEKQLGRERR